jgi:hypothetical protein
MDFESNNIVEMASTMRSIRLGESQPQRWVPSQKIKVIGALLLFADTEGADQGPSEPVRDAGVKS